MSQEVVETVTIENENGPVLINKSDYNPKEHKLHAEKKGKATAAEPVAAVVEPVQIPLGAKVSSNGKNGKQAKFFVVDAEGKRIDDVEYKTEQEAWVAAIPAAAPVQNPAE